jgi:NTE family protein
MATTALVISGGGSRGAFAVGALKYLSTHHPSITFDLFCGTGTSAIIAPLAALGEISLLEKLFTSNSTADIVNTSTMMQRFPQNNSLYNATALTQKINNIFTDNRFRALLQLEPEVFVAGKCLQTNRTTYFSPGSNNAVKKDYDIVSLHDNYSFREAVLASCSMPVFMPPVEVASLPDQVQQFTNGGGAHYDPVKLAIDRGATTIYAILLTPETPGEEAFHFKNLLDILEKQVDYATNEMVGLEPAGFVNDSLRYLDAVKNKMKAAGVTDVDNYFDIPVNPFREKRIVNLHIIRPQQALDVHMGGLEFIPAVMKEMLEAGEKRAAEIMNGK